MKQTKSWWDEREKELNNFIQDRLIGNKRSEFTARRNELINCKQQRDDELKEILKFIDKDLPNNDISDITLIIEKIKQMLEGKTDGN
mgnify:CR=1 FL=1